MKFYSKQALSEALDTLGLQKGDTLLVHSALQTIGLIENISPSENCAVIFDAIVQRIGAEGTIVVPTFNFGFCKGQLFDPAETPSKAMGAFSEYVRKYPGSVRSSHPMQPVSAVGAQAEYICANDTVSSFSPDGAFERMVEQDAKVLLLGAEMQAVSLVHLPEERLGVPYRYWKEFTAPYKHTDGTVADKTYSMYVRDLELDPTLVLAKIEVLLDKKHAIKRSPLGFGRLALFSATEFVNVLTGALEQDGNFLINE